MRVPTLAGIRQSLGRFGRWLSVFGSRRLSGRGTSAFLAVAALVVVGSFLVAAPVRADWITDIVIGAVGFLANLIVWFLGSILLIVVGVLINVAQYNSFVTAPAVGLGWSIVRDIVNMFFIVVLLIMAFGTILGVESYSVKGGKLTRLLIMAIVINFSRTLCGVMIDFGQVVMLTFVSGFKDAAGGNFIEAMKINEVMQASDASASEGADASTTAIVVSLILAVVMTAVATFVVIMMTIGLLIRIIYLWCLIVLSPIAFFLKAVPGGQASGLYAKWWSKFTSNVVFGPLMAFFLWLSLAVVQQGDVASGFPAKNEEETFADEVSAAFNSQSVQQFMIGVCLLLGGYMMANEVAGETMGMAKQIRQGAQSAVKRLAKTRAAQYLGRRAWAGTKTGIGMGVRGASRATSALVGGGLAATGALTGGLIGGASGLVSGGKGAMKRRAKAGFAMGARPGVTLAKEGATGLMSRAAVSMAGTSEGLKGREGRLARTGGSVLGGIATAVGITAATVRGGTGFIEASGRRDFAKLRKEKNEETMKAKSDMANWSKEDIKAAANGTAPVSGAEQRGAILKSFENGQVSPGDIPTLQSMYKLSGSNRMDDEAFRKAAKDYDKTIKSGGVDPEAVKDTDHKEMGRLAAYSSPEARKKYDKALGDTPEYQSGLESVINPDAAEQSRRAKKIADAPTAMAKNIAQSEFDTAESAARMSLMKNDKVNGSERAFGIGAGGNFDPSKPDSRKNYEKVLSKPDGGAAVLGTRANKIMNENNELLPAGDALLSGLRKGGNRALKDAANNAESDQEIATLQQILRAVEKFGTEDQKKLVATRAFDEFRPEGSAAAPRPAAPRPAAPAPAAPAPAAPRPEGPAPAAPAPAAEPASSEPKKDDVKGVTEEQLRSEVGGLKSELESAIRQGSNQTKISEITQKLYEANYKLDQMKPKKPRV